MLISSNPRGERLADVDSIHNYYEHMVLEEIQRQMQDSAHDTELFADVACVALNHLPPRYIRHSVDMAFYLSPRESQEMEDKVSAAVRDAILFVGQRGQRGA